MSTYGPEKTPYLDTFHAVISNLRVKVWNLVSENSKEIETASVFQSQIEKQEPENYATTINYQS